MSKVKLVVKAYRSLDAGSLRDTSLEIPENMEIVGVVRTAFEPEVDSSVRASDDLAAVIDTDDINNIVGKLLTLIDATFTDAEQRKAMKDIFQKEVWDWHHVLVDRLVPAWREGKQFQEAERAAAERATDERDEPIRK